MSLRSFCFCGLTVAGLLQPATAQRILAEHFGSQPLARHGAALAPIADFDGDGLLDLVVGEPHHDYSSAAGIVDTGAVVLRSSRTGMIRARQTALDPLGNFGLTVAAVGDVNGDGVADFAGGSPLILSRAGRVRVFSGLDGTELWRADGERLAAMGSGIAGLGDLNGDGRVDVAISAAHNSNRTPYSFVSYRAGNTGAPLYQIVNTLQTEWGRTIAAIPDVTGDGQPDLIVGEPLSDNFGQAAGRIALVDPRAPVPVSIRWSAGPAFYDFEHGGSVVAAAGDLDGDGWPEVLTAGTRGVVYAFSGANGTLRLTLTSALPSFGASIADAGDFDGDGWSDIAVGAPLADNGAGRVLIYARTGALIAELFGASASNFGAALAKIGDFDRDGLDDLAIGAPWHLRQGQLLGRVSIHGYRVAARAELFGSACASSSANPDLYPAGTPLLGEHFEARCAGIAPHALGFWMIGTSHTQSALGPLPFDLTPLGFGGCSFLVSHEIVIAFPTGSPGYVRLDLSVPAAPYLVAAEFYVQVGFVDPLATPILALSRGLLCRVGHP